MDQRPVPPGGRSIDTLDPEALELRIREAARELYRDRVVDALEVQHLMRVVLECSLLLTDVYSDERLARIMHPDRGFLSSLVERLIDAQNRGEGEVLYRVRRLPEDVRVVGDKALFDLGLQGLRRVKGYDLADLGARAYRTAAQALELLAEDRRLRRFFRDNRLLMLPLEEEVVFLNQCGERFRDYAEILRQVHGQGERGYAPPAHAVDDAARRVPWMRAAAAALVDVRDAELSADPYVSAAQRESSQLAPLARDRMLSIYERVLLFSALDLSRLQAALEATIIDQTEAIRVLCDEFSLFAAGTRDPRKPPAYFLVGPTGVGKNHLVESLCRLLEGLWHIDVPMLTIEGPNYTYPSDINELRGATRGFIRSDEDGLLTTFHERSSRSPLAVILVDEAEKAHPQLMTFFLSILDRGTTTDNRGTELNFANCMMFFTSNLGYSDAQQGALPIGYGDRASRDVAVERDVRQALRRALKPEFVNRVRTIHFNRLTPSSAGRILELEFERIAHRYQAWHGLRIVLDDSARKELILRGFSPTYGARHLAAILEAVCNVEIARRLRGDDRRADTDREQVLTWLREIRAGQRAFLSEEVDRRVRELASVRVDYRALRIVFSEGRFDYVPEPTT